MDVGSIRVFVWFLLPNAIIRLIVAPKKKKYKMEIDIRALALK